MARDGVSAFWDLGVFPQLRQPAAILATCACELRLPLLCVLWHKIPAASPVWLRAREAFIVGMELYRGCSHRRRQPVSVVVRGRQPVGCIADGQRCLYLWRWDATAGHYVVCSLLTRRFSSSGRSSLATVSVCDSTSIVVHVDHNMTLLLCYVDDHTTSSMMSCHQIIQGIFANKRNCRYRRVRRIPALATYVRTYVR